jgi:hypothetical protein
MTNPHYNAYRDSGLSLIGCDELIGSVLQVGDGRGFVVLIDDKRYGSTPYVITAAHCLPSLPPAHLARFLEEEIYPRLIGPLGADLSITAACVFADPVADLAVLGPPDNQTLADEHDHYMALLSVLPPFDIAAPPPRSRLRIPGEPPNFVFHEIAFPARLLSLDGVWLDCPVHYLGGPLAIMSEGLVKPGMSGSPLITASGATVGVVSTGNMVDAVSLNSIAACLWDGLPGWLLRALA